MACSRNSRNSTYYVPGRIISDTLSVIVTLIAVKTRILSVQSKRYVRFVSLSARAVSLYKQTRVAKGRHYSEVSGCVQSFVGWLRHSVEQLGFVAECRGLHGRRHIYRHVIRIPRLLISSAACCGSCNVTATCANRAIKSETRNHNSFNLTL